MILLTLCVLIQGIAVNGQQSTHALDNDDVIKMTHAGSAPPDYLGF